MTRRTKMCAKCFEYFYYEEIRRINNKDNRDNNPLLCEKCRQLYSTQEIKNDT